MSKQEQIIELAKQQQNILQAVRMVAANNAPDRKGTVEEMAQIAVQLLELSRQYKSNILKMMMIQQAPEPKYVQFVGRGMRGGKTLAQIHSDKREMIDILKRTNGPGYVPPPWLVEGIPELPESFKNNFPFKLLSLRGRQGSGPGIFNR